MTSYDLARLLLSKPELPIAVHANNHTYISDAHGEGIDVGLLASYAGPHIVIGNISKRNINGDNWRVTEMWHGDAPEEW